jgi:hypothetical protein
VPARAGTASPAATTRGGILPRVARAAAATPEVVLFGKSIHKWSFLSMNWAGWSYLPKIQVPTQTFGGHTCVCIFYEELNQEKILNDSKYTA